MSTRRQQELITSDCKAIVLRNKSNLISCDASIELAPATVESRPNSRRNRPSSVPDESVPDESVIQGI